MSREIVPTMASKSFQLSWRISVPAWLASLMSLMTIGILFSLNQAAADQSAKADVETYHRTVQPFLKTHCIRCHGGKATKADLDLASLDADLIAGTDQNMWSEVMTVLVNQDMPPQQETQPASAERVAVVTWISSELKRAAAARGGRDGRVVVRRLNRASYRYALQDLLGLDPELIDELSIDLPPDAISADGFDNNGRVTSLSAAHLREYYDIAIAALDLVVPGAEQEPATVVSLDGTGKQDGKRVWTVRGGVPDEEGIVREEEQIDTLPTREEVFTRLRANAEESRKRTLARDIKRLSELRKKGDAKALATPDPTLDDLPIEKLTYQAPDISIGVDGISVRTTGDENGVHTQNITLTLSRVPAYRLVRIRLEGRLWSKEDAGKRLRLAASIRSKSRRPNGEDVIGYDTIPVAADDGSVTLEIKEHITVPRYLVTQAAGNAIITMTTAVLSGGDYHSYKKGLVEAQWDAPTPEIDNLRLEHLTVSFEPYEPAPTDALAALASANNDEQGMSAVLEHFLPRVFRRPLTAADRESHLAIYRNSRELGSGHRQALIHSLAAALCAPDFLFLVEAEPETSKQERRPLNGPELASRMALFLWCSVPDRELYELGKSGALLEPEIRDAQVRRLLGDPHAARGLRDFVRQWLELDRLDDISIDRRLIDRQLDQDRLKEAMAEESMLYYQKLVQANGESTLLIDSNYTYLNHALQSHLQLGDEDVQRDPTLVGSGTFRKVTFKNAGLRGGILGQAAVPTLTANGLHTLPILRGAWIKKNLLADPPPPPPDVVPELSEKTIASDHLTLAEKLAQHRNNPACNACHATFDHWGFPLEEYDAAGRLRARIKTKKDQLKIESAITFPDDTHISGMADLRRFLLERKRDELTRALVERLFAYALGRSVGYVDRPDIDRIVDRVRSDGNRMQSIYQAIVASEAFANK